MELEGTGKTFSFRQVSTLAGTPSVINCTISIWTWGIIWTQNKCSLNQSRIHCIGDIDMNHHTLQVTEQTSNRVQTRIDLKYVLFGSK